MRRQLLFQRTFIHGAGMATWQRNLVFVWFSQFFSIAGFSLCLPFAPFYIQQLGVTDPDAVKFWASLSQAATGVSLAIMAPLWGALADRYGRKLMMLRANFCAVIVLAAMGFAPNAQVFVLLRFVQGAFTGTMNAAMTFVATSAPRERHGMALGTLSAAVFSGVMLGPTIGGVLADTIGYRSTFLTSSVLLLLSALVVLFAVSENFVPPSQASNKRLSKARDRWNEWGSYAPLQYAQFYLTSSAKSLRQWVAGIGPYAPLLLLLFCMAAARSFDQPILPLYVQQLHGALQGASRWTGLINGVGAVGAMLAGVFLGRLADRVAPPTIGKLSGAGAALCMFATGLAASLWALFPLRFLYAFCAGGLDPVFQVWLSKTTPEHRRGAIFGWSVTAKSAGWSLSPLMSGGVAVWLGIREVFVVGPLLFLALIPLIHLVSKRVVSADEESLEEAEVPVS
ncbi:MAG: MFS transporter [Chitinivibrionales bacterium]|nr:MFS transporter [Chitinivibrionales bacterium]